MIDASVEPAVYVGLAEERGWRMRHVLDTHVHADHLSRSRRLVEMVGAKLYMPEGAPVSFPHAALADGDAVGVGSSSLTAIRTPGHTAESTSYLLDGRALFTGDTLFLSAVGRPCSFIGPTPLAGLLDPLGRCPREPYCPRWPAFQAILPGNARRGVSARYAAGPPWLGWRRRGPSRPEG